MVSIRKVAAGVLAALLFDGASAQAVQRGGVATVNMNIPPRGSLSRVYGTVTDLPGPPETFKLCVYLEAQGANDPNAKVFNGPKPFEGDSHTDIMADGSFNYVQWWANNVYDVVTPFVYGVVVPQNSGNCDPVFGGPAFPPGMLERATGWVRIERPSPLTITMTAPALGTVAALTGVISGAPDQPVDYKLVAFATTATGALYSKPACGDSMTLLPYGAGQDITFEVDGWDTGDDDATAVTGFTVALVPQTHGVAGICMDGTAGVLPWDILGAAIVVQHVDRGLPPPPPPSVTPTPLPVPSTSSSPAAPAVIPAASPSAAGVVASSPPTGGVIGGLNASPSSLRGNSASSSTVASILSAVLVLTAVILLGS